MNPKLPEAIDEKPFEGMLIQSTAILDTLEGRHPCPQCYKSRKYFCYTCYVPIAELEGKIPRVKLPVKIDIIKHKNEIDGKSTAIHGAIISPEDIKIYTYPDIPDYTTQDKVYLVYPSHSSIEISDLFESNIETTRNGCEEQQTKGSHHGTLLKKRFIDNQAKRRCFNLKDLSDLPIKKAIFIDSTWNQSRGIYKDKRINRLPCIVLQTRVSQFWRHQKGSPRWYLATIEAIHQFLLEMHLNAWGVSPHYKGSNCDDFKDLDECLKVNDRMYNGQYDNILYFFSHMYTAIHKLYEHDKLQAYKRPMS